MLSVGISIHKNNNPENLFLALRSISDEQTLKPTFILLVIDGEIPNELNDIISKFKKISSCDIKIFVNKVNKGLTHSLNRMLENCETKYFARMDSDDISMPNRFVTQINFLENNPNVDIVGSFAEDIDENGRYLIDRNVPKKNNDILKLLPILNPMIHPSVIFRTDSIIKIGGYNEKYRTSQDYALWFKAFSNGLVFENIGKKLIKYRVNNLYSNRKNFKYRINDIKIKLFGFKLLSYPFYKYIWLIIPLIVWLVPINFMTFLKKLDPRQKIK